MKLVFRYRYWLHLVIYVLGLTAPWNYAVHLDPPGPNAHVWGLLSVDLFRAGLIGMSPAFNLVLGLGIFFATAGAALRTWGTAYLGSGVVKSESMHLAGSQTQPAESVAAVPLLEDGPYRHVRNPLYLGTFLHTLALTLLMPASGAIFTLLAIAGLQITLILSEEQFLTRQLGAAYQAYCQLVPQLWPRFKAAIKGTGARPRWAQAFLGETYFWAVAVSYAVAGWQGNAHLLLQCLLVSFGLSLLARAFVPVARGDEQRQAHAGQ